MTPQELYEKYKGRRGKYIYQDGSRPSVGIIIGYCISIRGVHAPLIMSVINNEYSWSRLDDGDIIVNLNINNRYQYCSIKNILTFKFGR